MSIPDMLEYLQPGDCITHCFRGGSQRLLDGNDRIFSAVRDAAERGVIFDVGHGAGSFQWEVVEAALQQGFEPTTISTDLHARNIHGPVYGLPTTMSKLRHLGVPLERVIEMTTANPARAIGREGELGTLRVGARADIALLEQRTGRFIFADSDGGERVGAELLVAATTIRGGTIVKNQL
jgi:dihydroorotase